ncbi:MAG: DUF2703 domain-containing protein [Chloroflexota bacterium]|nr:DUF2703 domain-containing protein [Chloroflexota bacterium]
MKIELLWFDECPSYQGARELLEQVLREEKIDAAIEMVQVRDHADALAKRFLGSPTIRLNGVDQFAEPGQESFAMQCRVYRTPDGLKGVPTKGMLRAAVKNLKAN